MAVDAPDPRTFKTWEDAFQYPIPAVRGMEKKLRNSVTENQEKLRSLVGTSYRELLGTARAIVTIDERLNSVESGLVGIGKRSDSRLMGKLTANYAVVERHFASEEGDRLAFGSQITLLQLIIRTASELLSHGQEPLLVAKLLVIARLLLKTLTESDKEAPILQKLKSRLMSRRERLLRHIDKRLAKSGRDVANVVNDLGAFSLATSAMPTDVLKHYNRLRLEALSRSDDRVGPEFSSIKKMHHFLETIRLAREIFPRRLKISLEELAAQPLFQDESVQNLKDLELDVLGKWVGDDIRNFTPWLRPDELATTHAAELIDSWAGTALESFANYLREALMAFDLRRIAQTRKELFELWLGSRERFKSSIPTLRSVRVLNQPFQERIRDIVQTQFGNLDHLPAELDTFLETLENQTQTEESLWDNSLLSIDTSAGAAKLRDAVISRRSGRSNGLRRIFNAYEECSRSIGETRKALKEMRVVRWDDYLDDEDEDTDSDAVLRILSPNPKDGVEKFLEEKAQSTVENVEASIFELVQHNNSQSTVARVRKAAALLRTLREFRQRLPSLIEQGSIDPATAFGHKSLDLLHQQLVDYVNEAQLPVLTQNISKLASCPTSYQELWSGSPPAPIQPSAFAFKYLKSLVQGMGDAGPDLWSPNLVRKLKARLIDTIAEELSKLDTKFNKVSQSTAASAVEATATETSSTTESAADANADTTNGISEKEDDTSMEDKQVPARDSTAAKMTQLLFDFRYLQAALTHPGLNPTSATGPSTKASTSASSLEQGILDLQANLDIESGVAERMVKGATEYWRRTYLLFGLLACAT